VDIIVVTTIVAADMLITVTDTTDKKDKVVVTLAMLDTVMAMQVAATLKMKWKTQKKPTDNLLHRALQGWLRLNQPWSH
jgi:hypothetical protein